MTKFRFKDFYKHFKRGELTSAYGNISAIDKIYRERNGEEVLLMTNELGIAGGCIYDKMLNGVLCLYEPYLQAGDRIIVRTWKLRGRTIKDSLKSIKNDGSNSDCDWCFLEIEENI